jgi:hypothetical protein
MKDEESGKPKAESGVPALDTTFRFPLSAFRFSLTPSP